MHSPITSFSSLRPRCAAALALVLLLFAGCATTPPPARRAALIVGNGTYAHASNLTTAAGDARAIGERLRALGWQVTTAVDLPAQDFDQAVEDFRKRTRSAEQLLFYYTGHSMSLEGRNYFVPVDYDPRSGELEPAVLEIAPTIQRMRSGSGQLAVLLDASYDNTVAFDYSTAERDRTGARPVIGTGVDEIRVEPGTYIGYSTTPGFTAYASRGSHSVFARALLSYLGQDEWEIGTILVFVRDQVLEETGGTQVPWDRTGLTGPFTIGPMSDDEEDEDEL